MLFTVPGLALFILSYSVHGLALCILSYSVHCPWSSIMYFVLFCSWSSIFEKKNFLEPTVITRKIQIDSSTIDGNVEFVHSHYSCILSSQVSIQFLCPTKSSIIVIILE